MMEINMILDEPEDFDLIPNKIFNTNNLIMRLYSDSGLILIQNNKFVLYRYSRKIKYFNVIIDKLSQHFTYIDINSIYNKPLELLGKSMINFILEADFGLLDPSKPKSTDNVPLKDYLLVPIIYKLIPSTMIRDIIAIYIRYNRINARLEIQDTLLIKYFGQNVGYLKLLGSVQKINIPSPENYKQFDVPNIDNNLTINFDRIKEWLKYIKNYYEVTMDSSGNRLKPGYYKTNGTYVPEMIIPTKIKE